jgi:Putative zinc-finger
MEYPAGWTCERVIQHLESYLLSGLALAESLAMAEHLEACEGCSQRLAVLQVTLTIEQHRG